MNTIEIFKRLKIGLSLVIGFIVGKWAASLNAEHYSVLFTIGFLLGAIGTQGMFRLYDVWRQRK